MLPLRLRNPQTDVALPAVRERHAIEALVTTVWLDAVGNWCPDECRNGLGAFCYRCDASAPRCLLRRVAVFGYDGARMVVSVNSLVRGGFCSLDGVLRSVASCDRAKKQEGYLLRCRALRGDTAGRALHLGAQRANDSRAHQGNLTHITGRKRTAEWSCRCSEKTQATPPEFP